ncbi:UNVERIFIED_CONTAM: hypothetical protein Sindi_2583600 [Sesamum indicum]
MGIAIWQGCEAALFLPAKMMPRTTDFPPARARRQAYRSLLPVSTMGKTTENNGSDGLTMAETSQPAKIVAGNLLRRFETVQTCFPTVLPARDMDSEVALESGMWTMTWSPTQRLTWRKGWMKILLTSASLGLMSAMTVMTMMTFKLVADMEDIIEGGTWLFQGQPIVLQKWEPGMVLRKLKHTQVPVWVKLLHLPMELWTEEGLSIVASGWHIIIMTPDEEGGELPCKVDVEYEWLPPRCTSCMTLGHSAKECTVNKPKSIKPPVNVYVPKVGALRGPMVTERTRDHPRPHTVAKQTEDRGTRPTVAGPSREERGKEIVTYNSFDALQLLDSVEGSSRGPKRSNPRDHQLAVKDIIAEFRLHFIGLLETRVGNQFIHCRVNIRALQEYVDITVVYGATKVSDRRELWASLESLAVQCINIPWLVGGDFNAVRDLSEVCGTSGDIRVAMEEFNTCLQNIALLPLPMQGECTTHGIIVVLALATCGSDLIFPSVFYQCLTPRTSDHSPMVVNGDNQQRFGGMFRFDNFLTLSPDFVPSVQSISQQQIVGVPMFSVTRKLKALKPIFREQRRNKGDLSHNVELARGFLEQAQVLVSSHRQDELILLLEHCSRLVYAKAAELERIMLQQRAKMEWMKGGDQCSRVFFRKIAQRRTARWILQINDAQRITITEPNAVIQEIISYYQSLLGGDRRQRVMDLRFLRPWARHIITIEEAGHLLEPAPGPDGYSSGFYKKAWSVVGQEITKAVLDFFSTGKLLKQINSTILTVIPKVHSPTSVADFRPISCCNVLYKIIAKLIVQKLSVILDKIISPCQAAFVPGRSIGDNVMLAQELFTGYNQARLLPRCALKVDIRKAYDTVDWDFLLSMFQSVSQRLSVDGLRSVSVHLPFRGLRQGDLLSPYLFVLVMEVLQMGILQLIEQDMNFAFHWKCDDLRIFQLGFADDLLLFCRANTTSVRVFKSGLDRFADWSGLRLNVEKSHIIISRSAQIYERSYLRCWGFRKATYR